MSLTPLRRQLLLWVVALIWGGALAALALAAGAQALPVLLAWVAGAGVLLLLVLGMGLALRLDVLLVQQAMRDTAQDGIGLQRMSPELAPEWQPLLDTAAALHADLLAARTEQADAQAQAARQLAALQAALDAARAEAAHHAQQLAQAHAALAAARAESAGREQQRLAAVQQLAALEAELAAYVAAPQTDDTQTASADATRATLLHLAATLRERVAELQSVAEAVDKTQHAARATDNAQRQAARWLQRDRLGLRRVADDLQLLGLNLRLSLAQLGAGRCADPAVLLQAERDLETLLQQLPPLEPPATDPCPAPLPLGDDAAAQQLRSCLTALRHAAEAARAAAEQPSETDQARTRDDFDPQARQRDALHQGLARLQQQLQQSV